MNFENRVKRIFINAAKIIERGKEDFSCIAINMAAKRLTGGGFGSPERDAAQKHYRQLFAPFMFGDGCLRRQYREDGTEVRGRKPFGSASFWNAEGKTADEKAQLKQQRITALLAAAASFEGAPYGHGF